MLITIRQELETSQRGMSTPEREKTLRRHMSEEDASSLTETQKKSIVAPLLREIEGSYTLFAHTHTRIHALLRQP